MQVLAPIHLSPHDPDTVYFGTQYLYRSRDRGTTWERLTGDLSYGDKTKIGDIPHQLVITISESPKKKGLIYTGTDDGRLYASVDDGKEFRELTAALPKKQWIAKVAASQHDEATVYVAQQGRYDEDFAPRVYKSTDYGKTFRSIAGNLPGGPINMIREDPVNPNVLYAANDFGVYVTTNGGARWEVLGGNLPSVDVMDFIVHPRDRMLVIGDARPRRVGDRCEQDRRPIELEAQGPGPRTPGEKRLPCRGRRIRRPCTWGRARDDARDDADANRPVSFADDEMEARCHANRKVQRHLRRDDRVRRHLGDLFRELE